MTATVTESGAESQCLAKNNEALTWVIGSGMVYLAVWKICGLIWWKFIQLN